LSRPQQDTGLMTKEPLIVYACDQEEATEHHQIAREDTRLPNCLLLPQWWVRLHAGACADHPRTGSRYKRDNCHKEHRTALMTLLPSHQDTFCPMLGISGLCQSGHGAQGAVTHFVTLSSRTAAMLEQTSAS
jgi:hypothetical protein